MTGPASFKACRLPFEYKYPTERASEVFDGEPARASWGWDGTRLGWVAFCPAQRRWLTWQANGSFLSSATPSRTRREAAALLRTLPEQADLYERELRWHRRRRGGRRRATTVRASDLRGPARGARR